MDRHVNPDTQDIGHDGPVSPTNRATKSLCDIAIMLDPRAFQVWTIMSERADEQGIFSGTTVQLAELLSVTRTTITNTLHGEGGLIPAQLVRSVDRGRWWVERSVWTERQKYLALGAPNKLGAPDLRQENLALDAPRKLGAQDERQINLALGAPKKLGAGVDERQKNLALAPKKLGASRAPDSENSFIQQERQKTTTTSTKHPIPPAGVSSAASSSFGDDLDSADNALVSRLC